MNLLKQAVLLGNADTKRTTYFRQAAEQAGLPVLFVDWKDIPLWKENQLVDWKDIPLRKKNQMRQGEYLIKIDPPLWDSCYLEELEQLARSYREQLRMLSEAAESYPLKFINDPVAIGQLLDKRVCKKKLEQAGLSVTRLLEQGQVNIRTAQQLFCAMQKAGVYQVFIKPVNGSGAAGVSAFRWQPKTGRMALYTCALLHPESGFVNTKRLRRFVRTEEVTAYLDRILALDCVIERWYAKAEYKNCSYDLRAVVLDGKIEYLLGRLSRGPVTNLHLNNHPLEAGEPGIPERVLEEIALLCKKATDCFEGIRIAGIDILLEKGSLRPRIIEMNAQGDLIYQDIFHENRIYKRQVQMMREWMEKKH